MKLVSARWVIPVTHRSPIFEGAVALSDDGTVLAVGGRTEVRAEFPDAVEERAQGVLMPGLVNAHCHLELSGLADDVPGGQGLFTWATTLMRVRRADTAARQREAAATAAAAAVAFGTAAVGDVGSSLAAAPGIGRAGLSGCAVPRAFRIARDGDRRRARRRLARARRGRRRLARPPRLRPGAARPLLRRSRAAQPHLRGGGRRGARDLDSRRRGRRRARAAARRLRPLACAARRHGRRPSDARAAQNARRLPGVAGRVPDRNPAAARPHGSRGC